MCNCAFRFNSVVIRNILLSCFLALLITPNLLLIIKHNETFLIDDEKMMSNLIGYCKDSNCLTIVPNHPVFTQDTTRMYTQWYLCFLKDKKEIKRDFDLNNVIKEIIMKKPVVVITGRYSFNFLLSKSDSNRWESFLNKNYTIKVIEGRKFYIRNDKLLVRHVY